MIAHLASVRLQPTRPPLIVNALLCLEEGFEWRLGIDDDLFAAGKVDDQIRPQPSIVRGDTGLLVEVAPLQHSGDLDDSSKLHLSPAPAHCRRAKCARQHVGGRSQRDDLFGQTRIRFDALALGLFETLIHAAQ